AEARRLGAEGAVDTAGDIAGAILAEWEDGVDACIDTIGLGGSALACVRDGGTFVTSVPSAIPDAGRDIAPQTVQVQPDAAALGELAERVVAGELTVRIAEVLPLDRFREAYELLEGGGLRGKVVLTP
ncbi:MAG TPA: zinc-binding dehydrogenase, partial [Acidimicrobiales bacterium]|nr:zinc-binding dehydrogenase [Acidimicrobiales bacterium]